MNYPQSRRHGCFLISNRSKVWCTLLSQRSISLFGRSTKEKPPASACNLLSQSREASCTTSGEKLVCLGSQARRHLEIAQSSLILKIPEVLVSPSLSTSWKASVEGKAKSRVRIWLLGLLRPRYKVWSHVFIFCLISWMR